MRLAAIAGLALSVHATTASANLVKVIFLGGQSNAVGQGDNAGLPISPVNLQLPQDDVLFYYTGGPGLTTLRPGSGGVTMGSEAKFGVEVTFGREIADASPSVTYAIIKHAESGTALYNDWAPGTGPSYTVFRNTVAAGLAALQNAGYTTEIVGMLWHQGESDALEGQQANYANNLTAFIADIRSHYGANLPFFIGEIRQNGPAYMTVVNAQAAIAAADPFARFVPATDLSFYDLFHFDAAGMITLGERFATAFLDLVSNDPGSDVTIAPAFLDLVSNDPGSDVTIAPAFSGSFTAVSSASDSAYEGDQSGSDLINGLTATVASVGWTDGGGATLPELNDGIHGAFPGGNAEGTWSNEGAIAEYDLGANAAGYDITSIQSIASWADSGFGNQVWTVEVKPVGGSYVLLATVDYTPLNNAAGATKVNLTGLDATGIESIRFTAGSTDGKSVGNDFVFREIDVEGTVTPVPPAATIESGFSGSFTAVSDPSDSAYEGDQSGSDLLNGLTATVATGWNLTNGSTVAELNDGIHGGFPGGDAEGTWSDEGAIAEYNLGPNAAGYDITSIQSIASWADSGFGNQVWTVEVKPVGGSYTLLATVDYTPLNNAAGATKVNLTGLDATGIESIRFTAGSTAGNSAGNDFVIREIDVEGAATPTPSDVTIESGFSGSFTAVSDLSDSAYEGDQSASDLLNGLTATVASVGWTSGGGATLTELNDGIHGAFPGGDAEGTWSNEGAIAEYDLGANAAGYDITSIQSIASWADSGFGNQVWTVEVKPVGGSYAVLATVDFTPFNNTGGATKVNLTGLDATGIESIRFTAGSTAGNSVGNDFVIREIDVEGAATPEPLRIMCLGDSLTVGYTDNPNWTHPFKFGYRSGLYTRLTNAEYNFQFVGASTEPWDGSSGDPTNGGTYTPAFDLRDFGQDGHRGYGGQAIWDNVDGFIAADNPDVILLLIGINGLGSGSQTALNNLVDSIVTTAPDVHLIVAQTSPLVSFDQTLYDYNVYIRDTLVPTYAGNGHKVSTVDLYTPFLVDPNNYASAIKPGVLSNNINHPDNTHYELMAQEWFEGIQALDFDSDNFDSWISDPAFGLAVADQDFADDSDGDQLGNGIEAWFGTHPGQFNTGLTSIATDGTTTTFTHPQNATLPGDLTGYYEWSPNLVDWYLSGNGPDGGSTVTFSTNTIGTTTTVTATASEGLDRIFLRAGVSQN